MIPTGDVEDLIENGGPQVKAVVKTLGELDLIIPTFAEAYEVTGLPYQVKAPLNLDQEGLSWGLVKLRLDYLRDLELGEDNWTESAGSISRAMSLYYDTSRSPERLAPHEEVVSPQGISLTGDVVSYAGGVAPSTGVSYLVKSSTRALLANTYCQMY
eukprot:13173333-Heterocapsa_arctica.AAC.1